MSSYDQEASIPYDEVKKAMSVVGTWQRPDQIVTLINDIKREVQIKGVMTARLMHALWENWDWAQEEHGIEDEFVDYIEAETGYSPHTTRKYVNMWHSIFNNDAIPEEIRTTLMGKPIKTLLLLPAAASEGQLDDKWEEIIDAPSKNDVQQIIREVRGTVTSSGQAIVIVLERDGTLKAKKGNGHYAALGYLNPEAPGEAAQAAFNRIITAAGVVRK